jgi:hypothetical protein
MHRRTFIQRATLTAVALCLGIKPTRSLTKSAPYKLNPAWINAPYEAHFLFSTGGALRVLSPYSGVTFALDLNPLRFSAIP